MKIKLAILEQNTEYLNQIVSTFGVQYAEAFQLYTFTEKEICLSFLEGVKVNVLLASKEFDVDKSLLPEACIYLEMPETVEEIYDAILRVYAKDFSTHGRGKEEKTKVVLFQSPCGGVGSSTMAAATAIHFAAKKKRTLYVNLERFGSSEMFFDASGSFDMSDVVFALKSVKCDLATQLMRCVREDYRGVYFYARPKIISDMLIITFEEKCRLISELKELDLYDYIVVDADCLMNKEELSLCHLADTIIWVSDGSDMGNEKIENAYEILGVRELDEEEPVTKRVQIVYNKFRPVYGKYAKIEKIPILGEVQNFENATTEQVLRRMFQMDLFDHVFSI